MKSERANKGKRWRKKKETLSLFSSTWKIYCKCQKEN